MNINSATKENNSVKINVTVDAAQFEQGLNKAYHKNAKYFNVPGFRKGKAPRRMIERLYGADIFHTDAVEEIFPEVYQEAVVDQGWKAVGQPSVTEMNVAEDHTVTLTIETALYPEVKLGQYKGLEVPKAKAEVTDTEVEAELDRKAKEVARVVTVDRPAQEGDTAVIDYEGFDNGVPFEGGKGESYELLLGSHSFIPGFEEQVIGLAAGEEKDLHVSFPEAYHAKELAGKPVVFKVKVHEVKETQIPAKDDELAKDVSEFDTLDELRADISATLLKEKTEGIDRAFENAVLEKAAETAEMDIPAAMIDEEVEKEMERFDYQLRSQGMSLQKYSEMLGGDLSGFKASVRPSAEKQLKIRLTLEAVADAENVEISDEEVENEYKQLAEQYGMDLERVKAIAPAEEIKGDLRVRKAKDVLVSNAVATDEPEAAPAEE